MEHPETHYYYVSIQIPPRLHKDRIQLVMPSWTPGSYVIRDFARNVIDFQARDSNGRGELTWTKISKNEWVVESKGTAYGIEVSYRVYAFEYTVDTSYLDEIHGIINGASVFMYVEGFEKEEHLLSIVPHSSWKQISTSLEVLRGEPVTENIFTAQNYDILVDSPMEIGNQEIRSFVVQGITHDVSLFGPRILDDEKFVADLEKIVDQTWKVFGTIPYRRYLFLVDFAAGPRGGGLEHLSSTHCIVLRFRLMPAEEYRQLMGLFSHELFHAWNVKRMRPKGLGPFDYSSETYTRSLWIAEGFTSYYDDLILRRAKIYSPAEYLDAFCINVDYMKSLPSSRYQSADESSFDTWISHYRPDENTPNVRSSYYQQGAVIAWMIDMEIRETTKNARTLDDALKKLYNESYVMENRGYEEGELERICNEIAGKSLSREIFDTRVRGREQVDYDKYLGYTGLRLDTKTKNNPPKGYIGFKTRGENGKTIVASRLFGSPAEECGLSSGDEILAFNNLRVDSATLPFLISNAKLGERIQLLVSRDGVLHRLEATVGEAPQFEHRINKRENATPEQKSLYRAWMDSDWDLPLDYPEYVPSPQRTKLYDYV